MKTKKNFLTLLLALVIAVGSFVPALAAPGDPLPDGVTSTINENQISKTEPTETTINIYKLGGDKYNEKAPWDHNGGKINDTSKLGDNVAPLKGVKFKIYKIKPTDNGKYADADYQYLETLKNGSDSYKTVVQMDAEVTKNKVEVATANGLTNGVTNATGDDGLVSVTLPSGLYWVVEAETPTNPKSVSDAIAVPFALTLPFTLTETVGTHEKGTAWLKEINIYPKNILSGKPTVKKFFTEDENGNKIKNGTPVGPEYAQYLQDKDKISKNVGEVAHYKVTTDVPQNSIAPYLTWSDTMSKGLEYQKDLKITVTYKNAKQENKPFTIPTDAGNTKTETVSGFVLSLLTKKDNTINNSKDLEIQPGVKFIDAIKRGPVTFTLTYSAKVTSYAIDDKPLENNITFTPGKHDPKEPKVQPNPQGEITVTKTWDDENTIPEGTIVTYYLKDDQGKVIADITLDKNSKGKTFDLGDGIKFIVDDTNWYSGKFTGLDKDKNYTFEEKVNGYVPEYGTPQDGALTLKNKKNPDSITPKPPVVITGERKFVKTDSTAGTNKLSGAKFIVKNDNGRTNKGKYLALKSDETAQVAKTAYEAADKKYNDAIANYNKERNKPGVDDITVKISIDGNEYTGKTNIFAEIAKLKADRDKKFKEAKNNYYWEADEKKALVFTSNDQGQIYVSGLAYGDYELIEIQAPDGYAKLKDPIQFKINGQPGTNNIKYDQNDTANNALKVVNRKLTIPQTGGIGTAIFAVVGVALMAGAVIAMKKRSEA